MTHQDPTHEAHLQDAAQAFQNRITDTVDLDAALDRSRRTPTRTRSAVVLAVAALIALFAGVIALQPEGEAEVAVDEDEDGTTSTTGARTPTTTRADLDRAVPDIEGMPAPVALGAPDDGKDSVGLPVDADPKTDLVDGQQVTVYGAQFPPNESVGVVMCAREAGRDHGARGADACNLGHVGSGSSDGDGNVTVTFNVRRFLTLDGQEIDCASEEGRCLIGMGLVSDYDQSGGVLVDFDPDAPVPDPPTVQLSRSTGLADGDAVQLVAENLTPNAPVYVQQCTADRFACAPIAYFEVSGDGRIDAQIRIWRSFGAWGAAQGQPANIDCAVLAVACVLSFDGQGSMNRPIPTVALGFDPSGPSRTPPEMRLLDTGPFRVGDHFDVAISGAEPGTFADLSVCDAVPDSWECLAYGGTDLRDGSAIVRVHVDHAGTSNQCADGCPLIASLYNQSMEFGDPGDVAGPPPLFPEPVMVQIVG